MVLSKILPARVSLQFLAALPFLELWRKQYMNGVPTFKKRQTLYDHLQEKYIADAAIDYWEFGVFKGASMKYWSELHQNKESQFYGFDTFTGLPEDWDYFAHTAPKNKFDVESKTPQINDPRISFVKGLFQDTLPSFLEDHPPTDRKLVLHMDADLYSATLYVLTRLHEYIKPGTIIIFDEFSSMLHEFRALEDYCSAYGVTYKALGATVSQKDYYVRVAIEIQ